MATLGDRRGVGRVLVGRPKEERQGGRPRHIWEGNINPYPANVENMVSS